MAYLEYLVVAAMIAVATLAFYTTHLRAVNGNNIRGTVETTFVGLCQQVAGTNDCGP